MKPSQHLGRYRWKGDRTTALSAREEEQELTEAWEHYLTQTLAQQRREREQ